MAKKTVSAQTPKNTDVLKINDIINQKIDIPAGHQLTYFPITGAVASSSVANQGPLLVLDTSPDTYWQPSDQVAGAHIELQTPNPYECYGVDIKFKESEGKKFNLKVDILDKEHNRWLTIATAESSLIDDNKYERFQAAQHFKSDTYRVIINSVFDTATNSIYTQPKITQIRLFGFVPDADVAKYKVIKDQECPEGYGKDAESGQCVKSIPSEIIKPKTVDCKSAVDMGKDEPTGNDPENLLSVNPNDKLTLKGVGSTIEYSLSRTDAVYGVYIHKLNNPPRQYTLLTAFYNGQDKQPFYSFVVDIPDSQDKYVHILNQPIRADRFVLSVVDNTEPNQWFSLFGLYLIGQPNAGPESPEPEDKGRVKDWGSVDTNPNNWKVVSMKDDKTKFKVVDKDNVNVADNFNTKKGAQKFIDDAIANYKPTEPPVEPPVEPPAGSGFDKNGVKLLFAKSENVDYKVEKDTRSGKNDGIRWNWKIDGATASEAWGYFRFSKNPVDDEVSIKWSEKSHSGSNDVQCYDTGVEIKTGKVRMRFENPHPQYSGNIGSGQGAPLNDKWIGYKGVKIPQADGSVLIELYQDAGDNETKPSNQWKKIYSHKDTKYKRTGAHPYITIRVDDPAKKGQKDLEEKWLGASKI